MLKTTFKYVVDLT